MPEGDSGESGERNGVAVAGEEGEAITIYK